MPIHLKTEKSQLAPFVIVPGDADRSTYIAENYLKDVVCYTKYRHLLGYTGTYKGVKISVQTTGMGVPSCMIVCEELVMLGAKCLIRIGTCGGLQEYMKLGETVLATTAWGSRETVAKIVENEKFCPTPDLETLLLLQQNIKNKQKCYSGPITTGELFYDNIEKNLIPQAKLGCLAVEMETAGLFALGAKYNLKTACILTISDLVSGESLERASEEAILKGVEKNTLAILDTIYMINTQT